MKTPEEILDLEDVKSNNMLADWGAVVSRSAAIKAMKIFLNEKIDAISESARLIYHDGHHKSESRIKQVMIGADNIKVDKEHILSFKEKT